MSNLIYLTRKPSLRDSILDECPQTATNVLDELEALIKQYDLTWIPGSKGEGGYFLGKELAQAKGNDSKDFAKHFERNTNSPLFSTSPQVIKLEGENLKNFKSLYQHYTHRSLGSINSLYIANWAAAYSYLTQGQSKAAQDFQNLGAKAIVNTTASELVLQNQLALLAMRTPYNFRQELVIADTLRSGQHTRRYDLVQYSRTSITIYELKKGAITKEDVMNTLGEKGYLTLAESHPKFNNKKIRLIFISPYGIDPAAQRMIDQMPKVGFVTLYEFAIKLLKAALKDIQEESPGQVGWYLKEKFLKDYPDLFPAESVKLLMKSA